MKPGFPRYGWAGLGLTIIFWGINWFGSGLRTHWAFFPMWLGYCLVIDALVWWLFEALNLRTQNCAYLGAEGFSPRQYAFWTTLSFTTVVPAVFGSAEFIASFRFIQRLGRGPIIRADKITTISFFVAGWLMLDLMLIWPQTFFPFIWLSIYFISEPLNVWLGNRSLAEWTGRGDWRPVIST